MNTTCLSESAAREAVGRVMTGPVVGVRTTRIYCRPICHPGRAPRPENCIPFADASAAREAGYRACKQCRPDDPEPPTRRSAAPVDRTLSGPIRYTVSPAPFGHVFVASTDRGVCAVFILEGTDPAPALERLHQDWPGSTAQPDPDLDETARRVVCHVIEAAPCEDIPLDLRGTPFQLRVWAALREIPHGSTLEYGELARKLGLPKGSARAVGTACGANPVSLIVPCHRVLRAGGALGGYYWGLDCKRRLLDLERAAARPEAFTPRS